MAVTYELCVFLCAFGLVYGAEWSYDEKENGTGPVYWPGIVKSCGGVNQSPINIDTKRANYNASLTKFDFTSYKAANLTLTNDGHSARADVLGTPLPIQGGGLDGQYELAQFHFHWGAPDTHEGSEHVVNGRYYPLELHLVHIGKRYHNLTSALGHRDGLAVLGIFFETDGNNDNVHYKPITEALSDITNKSDTKDLELVPLNTLLPADTTNYYRYSGSLTTPGCTQAVVWTVFQNTVKISTTQLAAFHKLKAGDGTPLLKTYRPAQPLNGRKVSKSFDTSDPTCDANVILPTTVPLLVFLWHVFHSWVQ